MDGKEKSQTEDTEGQAKRLAEDEDDTEGQRRHSRPTSPRTTPKVIAVGVSAQRVRRTTPRATSGRDLPRRAGSSTPAAYEVRCRPAGYGSPPEVTMKTEERTALVEPARGHDVFVSYSRADRERVLAFTQGLAERGKRAWVDLEDIPPSAEWMAEIRSAIEAADGYLVVVSPALAGSKVCAEELEHARAAGKRIVPVLVRPTDPDSVPRPWRR